MLIEDSDNGKVAQKKRLTAIDLFAGAGGFSLAAQMCDVDVRAAVEHDFHACATYRANLVDPRTKVPFVLEQDINDVKWPTLLKKANLSRGECDLLLGGGHHVRDFQLTASRELGSEIRAMNSWRGILNA